MAGERQTKARNQVQQLKQEAAVIISSGINVSDILAWQYLEKPSLIIVRIRPAKKREKQLTYTTPYGLSGTIISWILTVRNLYPLSDLFFPITETKFSFNHISRCEFL